MSDSGRMSNTPGTASVTTGSSNASDDDSSTASLSTTSSNHQMNPELHNMIIQGYNQQPLQNSGNMNYGYNPYQQNAGNINYNYNPSRFYNNGPLYHINYDGTITTITFYGNVVAYDTLNTPYPVAMGTYPIEIGRAHV